MPEFIVEIPEFVNCFAPQWMQAEYRLSVELHSNAIVIMGDANGLKNLAIQLLSLTRDEAFSGYHLHLDSGQMLDDDSENLIIQRI
jgi:hypothetical protein